MSWGGLNPALTSWRGGILVRFPHRGSQSDGGYADKAHGSNSQHQPDTDGSVDAFDCDVNFLGSSVPTGTAAEKRILEALKLDFEADGRAQLWISNREIANADIDHWRERDYAGPSPHDHHTHFQSRQSRERDGSPWKFTHTDSLLRKMEEEKDVTPAQVLEVLQSEAGQAALARAAGVGVHNQKLGRSDETIGQDLQADDAVLAARFDAIDEKLTAIEARLPAVS